MGNVAGPQVQVGAFCAYIAKGTIMLGLRKASPPDNPLEPEEAFLWFMAMFVGYILWQIMFPWFGLTLDAIRSWTGGHY